MNDGMKSGGRRTEPNETKIQSIDETDEPAFRPPEEIAAQDPVSKSPVDSRPAKPAFAGQQTASHRRNPIEWFKDLSKKQKIILLVVVLLVVSSGGTAAFLQLNKKPAPVVSAPVTETPKAETPKEVIIYSALSGMPISKEQSELPVTGIMIENSPDSRPQSGINQAGVVFEAIAEGGITRFLTLFQENQPDYVGPVRSVRPYYVDWLQGFDAAIAHVGGSAEALNKIKAEGVRDLDQFANSGPYRRVSNRYAPHNVYTSLNGLTDLQKSKGWTSSSFTGFPRKPEAPSTAPTARTVDITISGQLYNVHYDYDLASNTYKRSLAGKAHLDERSKEQLSPKVVVALVIPYGIHPDRIHSVYQTIGSGKTVIFQDGIATEGTWEKTSTKTQLTFKDAAGAPIKFNAGQTWITATSIASNVVYKP